MFAKQIPKQAAGALSRENTKLTEFALSPFFLRIFITGSSFLTLAGKMTN